MKFCKKCRSWKDRAEFNKRGVSPDGLQAKCRACMVTEHRPNSPASVARRRARRKARRASSDLGSVWAARHRARCKAWGVPAVVEAFTVMDLLDRYGGACFYCGGPFECLDHWIPAAAGGAHELSNVAPCCNQCNGAKMSHDLGVIKLAKSLFQDESDGLSGEGWGNVPPQSNEAVTETEAS